MGRKLTRKQFIEKANIIHGNVYDYSSVEYINNRTKVKIKCSIHGEFLQLPTHHLMKHGCPKCGSLETGKKANKAKSLGKNKFIEKANIIHGNVYDYSSVEYINTYTKIKIKCSIHGEFLQQPRAHINNKQGCPICKTSKGEKETRKYLIKNNINFVRQKTFNECRNQKVLPFDFYLPELNILIEYDGIQHYKPVNCFGGQKTFEKVKINDKIKNNYCINNNIILLRIKYNEDIKEVLDKNIKKCYSIKKGVNIGSSSPPHISWK